MTTITKPALNLRERLAALAHPPRYQQSAHWFAGDASEVDFTLPAGWKPLWVTDDGALQKDGAAEAYTVSFDGFAYTVTFAVAPALDNDICIFADRIQ